MSDKKKGFIIFLVLGVFIFILIPVIAKVLFVLFENKFNFSIVTSEYIKSVFFSFETYKVFYNFKIENPFEILGYGALLFYVGSYLLNLITAFTPKAKYLQTETYGSHGTSRWQTEEEIKNNYYQDQLGWFLGTNKSPVGWFFKKKGKDLKFTLGMDAAYHKVNGKLNMQTIVIGPPGTNKTTGLILPNILHLPYAYKRANIGEMPDMIITDPKSELYCLTSDYLTNQGYDVKVLDFINLKYGDSINSIEFIDDDKTLMEICKGYIDSVEGSRSSGGGGGDQAFWNAQETQLLSALVGYVKAVYPKEKQTFTEVAKLLASPKVNDEFECKNLFEGVNVTGAALQMWNNFMAFCENEKTKSNIVGGLAEKMVLFSIEGIQKITQKTTIDLMQLGRKKEKPIALFILMPDQDKTFTPIINVMVSTMFKQLYKNAYKCHNRLENPVYFILEEMANIGKLPNMLEMLGTMRGRRIYPMMIWQSLAQMKERYRDGYEDMISMCDTKIYLGVNDSFTAKYCSESLGPTTIQVQNTSKKGDHGLTINDRNESISYNKRMLMMPDELERMNLEELIIKQMGNFPCKLAKTQYKYWEDKTYREVTVDSLKELEPISIFSDMDIKPIEEIKVVKEKEYSQHEVEPQEEFYQEEDEEKENIFDKPVTFEFSDLDR